MIENPYCKPCFWISVIVWVLAVVLGVFLVYTSAQARDDGRYAQSPLKPWFERLINSRGERCCDEADRVEVDEWSCTADDKCEVTIGGVKREVPPKAILREPNLAGIPLVWIWNGEIKCFVRGTEV
jgi:hypothetical protein